MKNSNVKKNILRIILAALMIVSLSVLASCYSGAEFPGGNEEGSHSVYRGTEPFAVVSRPYPYQNSFTNGGLTHSFDINLISKIPDYDYVEITYIPTFNVTLTDAEMDVIPYSENDITIPVEFTVSEPLFDGMILDPSQITIERIMITAIAYKDGEAILADIYKDPNPPVRFSDLDVYIFSTPHGVFVSPGGADIVYMKYIAYLRDNGFITHTEWHNAIWRSAKPTMTDFVVPSENPKSLDEADESLENLSKASNEERSMSLTSATQTENIIYLPTVNLNYAIETLNGGNQIEISGIVQWTDIESNLHPARQLDIEINDNLSKLPCKQ